MSYRKRRRDDSPEYSSSKRRKHDYDRDYDRRDDRYDRDYDRRDDRYDRHRKKHSKDHHSHERDDRDRRSRRHHSRDRDEDDRRKDRDRDRDRDRNRDRERDRDRDRGKERYHRDRDHDKRERQKSPSKEERQAEIEAAEKKRKEEAAKREEEERQKQAEEEAAQEKLLQQREEEQQKLDQEMKERKERIAKWRKEVLKKKLQEKEEVEKALQKKEEEAKEAGENPNWSFDDDNADGHTTNEPDKMQLEYDTEGEKNGENSSQKNEEVETKEQPEEPEIDPLEAYMQQLSKTPVEPPRTKLEPPKKTKKKNNELVLSDEEYEAPDSDDEEWKQKIRKRELQRVDHSKINYMNFRKDFYIEVPEIAKLTKEEVSEYRKSLGNIKIRGKRCPKPIKGFHQCGLSDRILETLRKLAYTTPTPIQAQAIPAIMSGNDVIGIAKTGSGKTLAFLLPMLRHILDQPLPTNGEGPIGIIMAPTRELAVQIHTELRRFSKRLGIKSVCIFGGSGISHQIGDLKRGAAVAVCTPGRMIDILCTNAGRVTNLRRVTYLVLDEADRMFDMGFEPQIMRIIDNIRPDRQTVMFSATFPRQVEAAARKILKRPIIEIIVGGVSVVCSDVQQIVEVRTPETRFARLLQILGEWNDKGSILIFVNQQEECDNIFKRLTQAGYKCSTLHGGKDQMDRASTIADFKRQDVSIMVATSVAARGLDVPSLNLVINYSVPNHYEDYVHRCGRTGRAGRTGTAVTFISEEEEQFAPDLEKALTESGVEISEELKKLCDNYRLKLTAGGATKHGSGFGGSGYKFDEEEAQAKKKQEQMQRRIYLDEDNDEEEEEEEEMDEPVKQFVEPTKPAELTKSGNKIEIDDILHKILQNKQASGDSDEHTAELEINDYPQQARWKVTHKDALAAITEFTGCAITTRGTYVPAGRPTPLGERKLYLYIEGPNQPMVNNALKEIKRILAEAAQNAAPEREQYGKYSIL